MSDVDRYLEAATRQNTQRSYASALRHFEADDWLAIDAITARVQHDPLLSTSTEDRFAQLRRVIAAEADCGCEQEPALGGLAHPGA